MISVDTILVLVDDLIPQFNGHLPLFRQLPLPRRLPLLRGLPLLRSFPLLQSPLYNHPTQNYKYICDKRISKEKNDFN
jgi:hypothetical protein